MLTIDFAFDKIHGNTITTHPNGKLLAIRRYVNGLVHGKCQIYYDTGIL
jgi:antitoxin component YwqK of YwqJK toxin-antitoxin module